jgi:GR25 family glycosyltransferase involved in LPS biosynthesis
MSALISYFEQIWVINLKRRPDRLKQFQRGVRGCGWPFRKPKVFSAIEGDKVGVPKYWQTGGGSYGCMRSHMALLERAIQDDVDSILLLEDDAIFRTSFGEEVADFLAKVPDDWQCLMLGGQHVNSKPFPVVSGVVRAGVGGGIQRTHCYALRGQEIMRALYETWANAAVHCDWVMGPCTAHFNTYAPDPFLVGQSEGDSDISGARNPPKFWRSPSGKEPVIVLQAPRTVMESLR